MYEKYCLLVIFLRLTGIAKIKNAKIKMLRFGTKIAKISNRRKYLLYGNSITVLWEEEFYCIVMGSKIKVNL